MEENERFRKGFTEAKKVIPGLNYIFDPKAKYSYKVTGIFKVIDEEGHLWGAFQASIHFMRTYPKGFPVLCDESKAFPWDIDWHMSPKNGECCVCSPLESIEIGHKGISILEFIKQYVIPFYANQIYKREYGEYKNGEYSHFQEGVWESLEEEFSTKDRDQIRYILSSMKAKRGRNVKCFCGSGKKFKMCHWSKVKFIVELTNNSL